MTSFMGTMFKVIIRNFFNVNPETCSDQIKCVKKLENGMSYKTNKGYEITRETTESGVKYERAHKKGAENNSKAILYLHGGAYAAGLIGLYREMVKDLSEAGHGAEVFFLDYKLAPEYKYPTQLNEAFELWRVITEDFGYKPENIVIGGDSAGGNLTLALMLKLRDTGMKMPKAAFCISPWADMTASGKSYFENYQNDVMFGNKKNVMTPELRLKLLNCDIFSFAGDGDRTDPYISPVYGDYTGFPPMFFTVGSHEMLLSDTLTIVEKLRKLGIDVGMEIGDKLFHIYTVYYKVIPEARKSFALVKSFIAEQLQ